MQERGGAILIPQQTRFYFWVFYVCAYFGENRSKNATVRVCTDGYRTDTLTDANQFYNLSHTCICYSYGQRMSDRCASDGMRRTNNVKLVLLPDVYV